MLGLWPMLLLVAITSAPLAWLFLPLGLFLAGFVLAYFRSRSLFWWAVHNIIAHPMLAWGWEWTAFFHDYSATRMGSPQHKEPPGEPR